MSGEIFIKIEELLLLLEQRHDNVQLRNVELTSWLSTDVVSSRYLAIIVILIMHFVS